MRSDKIVVGGKTFDESLSGIFIFKMMRRFQTGFQGSMISFQSIVEPRGERALQMYYSLPVIGVGVLQFCFDCFVVGLKAICYYF